MTERQTGYLKKQHTVYIKLKLKLPWGLKYIYTQELLFFKSFPSDFSSI